MIDRQQEAIDDDTDTDIDSGDESDGQSALRGVETKEKPKAARRGPGNASMRHFYDPTATVDRSGQKRWEFRCRFCVRYARTL
jgi:hypothetical protein